MSSSRSPEQAPPSDDANDRRDHVLRLFLQHQAALSGFLFTMCEDWEVVEEAVQETAIFICRRWADFVPGTNFAAWVRAVARLRCYEAMRRRPRASEDHLGVAETFTETDWSASQALASERTEALRRCLDALPSRDRDLVARRYRQEDSCDDIARALGSSVDALYMTLSRLRRRLRICIERRLSAGTDRP